MPQSMRLLLHRDANFKLFLTLPQPNSRDGHGVPVVTAGCHAHVALVRRNAVRNIERDPSQVVDMGFCPGMARCLLERMVHHQVATHIARWKTQQSRGGNKYMAVVLADTAALLESCLGRSAGIGRSECVSNAPANHTRQPMQPLKFSAGANLSSQIPKPLARYRQPGFALEKPKGGETAMCAHYAGRIVSFHLTHCLNTNDVRFALHA